MFQSTFLFCIGEIGKNFGENEPDAQANAQALSEKTKMCPVFWYSSNPFFMWRISAKILFKQKTYEPKLSIHSLKLYYFYSKIMKYNLIM